MNIVRILQDLVKSYDDENKCGLCWEFTHARKDYANLKVFNSENKCCVHFILQDFESKTIYTYDRDFGISEATYIDDSFTVMIGSKSRLDMDLFNEGLNEDKSKFVTHVEPLLNCLKYIDLDICNNHVAMINSSFKPKYNYQDANLDGVIFRGTIRTHIQ